MQGPAGVLNAEHIALVRELQLVAQLQDAAAPAGLVQGLPMLGQAAPARGLMRRYHLPLASIARWESGRVARNMAALESIHSSSDIDLDIAALEKPMVDIGRGVLLRLFEVAEDVVIGTACYVPRRGTIGCPVGQPSAASSFARASSRDRKRPLQ